jgi:competence ComEA-like helix-hairpin-helix protein
MGSAARVLDCHDAVEVDGSLVCGGLHGTGTPRALECANGGARSGAVHTVGDALEWEGCDLVSVGRMRPADIEALALPVDINRAEAGELATLRGIGPVLAQRIIAERPFDSTEQLTRVKGIGPRKLEALRARARVGATVSPN